MAAGEIKANHQIYKVVFERRSFDIKHLPPMNIVALIAALAMLKGSELAAW